MRKLILVFSLISCIKTYAVEDTLRHWDRSSILVNDTFDYDQYTFRFDIEAPGTLKKVNIIFGGGTGTCTFHLYGHEGGTPYLSYLFPEISPKTITKSVVGLDTISVTIPNVFFDNNQFFILITDLSQGMEVMRDTVDRVAYCSSSSGGDLVYYTAIDTTSHNFGFAPAIDCIFEYATKTSPKYMEEVTLSAGLSDSVSNKTMAAADYNGDGYTDILISGILYENDKDGTFTDKTSNVGLSGTPISNIFADVDNDGDLDIVFYDVEDKSYLYTNNSNVYVKTEITSLPVFVGLNALSMADLNNDGFLDIFAGQLAAPWPQPAPNYLLYSDKNGGYLDSTLKLIPRYFVNSEYPSNPNRMTRGSAFVDYDDDGDMDLFATNYRLHPDEFYRNNGNGKFTDICYIMGIDRTKFVNSYNHGTGVDWGDYDNDGDMDLLLSQFAHPRYIKDYDHRGTTIHRNTGAPDYKFEDTFLDVGGNGIQLEETAAGATWGDVNNDGLLDIIKAAYYGCRFVDVLLQKEDHTFELKTWEFGLDKVNSSQDVLWLDYDNDGKLDLLTGEGGDNSMFRLYHNTGDFTGNYIYVNLKGTTVNKFAVGAKVKVYAGGQIFTREVGVGRGQLMQEEYRQHIGLGTVATIDSVTVQWPGTNGVEVYKTAVINSVNTYTEGSGLYFLSVKDEKSIGLELYPNPASKEINFNSEQLINKIIIFDITGKMELDLKQNACNTSVIDISNLSKGMKFIHFYTENGDKITKKIVIE